MQSHITKLFDYHTLDIPEELTRWRIPEAQVQEHLASVALRHAKTVPADSVSAGDAVRCTQCGEGLPGRSTVLLYPGRALPGAEQAEQDVLNRKIGEQFATQILGFACTLQVQEILRNTLPALDDDLAKLEGEDTLEQYIAQYKGQTEKENRENAAAEIAIYWLRQMSARSEADVVEEERNAYAMKNAKEMYERMVAAGIDPTIPEEGTDFLTEEQALEKMAEDVKPSFFMDAVSEMVAKEHGTVYDDNALEAEYRKSAEQEHKTVEACKAEFPPEELRSMLYFEAAIEILSKEAEPYLEV